jgi:transcriptional regulator with XRE-family HTH domain
MASKIACGGIQSRARREQTPAMRKVRPIPKHNRRPTFIRAWRKHRDLTQKKMIERLEAIEVYISEGQLSRIENSKQEYRQDLLEAFAEVLNCEPWQLLWADPKGPGTIMQQVAPLKPDEQAKVSAFIQGMKATGTGG